MPDPSSRPLRLLALAAGAAVVLCAGAVVGVYAPLQDEASSGTAGAASGPAPPAPGLLGAQGATPAPSAPPDTTVSPGPVEPGVAEPGPTTTVPEEPPPLDVEAVADAGAVVSTVRNHGTERYVEVTVVAEGTGPVACPAEELGPGEEMACVSSAGSSAAATAVEVRGVGADSGLEVTDVDHVARPGP